MLTYASVSQFCSLQQFDLSHAAVQIVLYHSTHPSGDLWVNILFLGFAIFMSENLGQNFYHAYSTMAQVLCSGPDPFALFIAPLAQNPWKRELL